MLSGDVSRARRKVKRDAMAAQLILQAFLDFRSKLANGQSPAED
jgi:RNase H-fold protein (predicted Holliday junction resolvase)